MFVERICLPCIIKELPITNTSESIFVPFHWNVASRKYIKCICLLYLSLYFKHRVVTITILNSRIVTFIKRGILFCLVWLGHNPIIWNFYYFYVLIISHFPTMITIFSSTSITAGLSSSENTLLNCLFIALCIPLLTISLSSIAVLLSTSPSPMLLTS